MLQRSKGEFGYAALLIMVMLSPAAFAKESVPDWVRDAAKETVPPLMLRGDPEAVVLLSDTVYTVNGDQRATEHHREVIRILRSKGRHYADMGTYFDKDSKIRSMHIWSIGPDGHEYAVKENELSEHGNPGGGILYEDERYRGGHAPAGDIGAVVALEYEQDERPYMREYLWQMQGGIPVHRNRLTLALAPGVEYRATWKRHDTVEPVNAGANQWRWELLDMPMIDLHDTVLAPSRVSLESLMSIDYTGQREGESLKSGWRGMGEWYQKLAQDRAVASPEAGAKAQALVAGKSDFFERAMAIGNYVQQDIRYFAIEIGVGGYQPHMAQDIFHNKYGDCKDKATLLRAMLSSVGIHSTWVLVDTRRGFVSEGAPMLAFNHAIGAIEIPEGYESPKMYSVVKTKSGKRFLIFDPTWEMTPFGQLEHELQGGYGLLVDGKESEVIALPVMPPDRSMQTRTAHFQLSAEGLLSGDVIEKRSGDLSASYRYRILSSDDKDKREMIDRLVNRDLSNVTLTDVKLENVQDIRQEMVLSYQIKAERYAQNAGNLMMMRPRVLGTDSMRLDTKMRVYPINLNEAWIAKDEFYVDLPAGYVMDELPAPVKMDVGFAAYESASEMKGNTLHYSRTYTVREVELPAEKYSDLQNLVGAIENDERGRAILKKKQ